MPRNSRPRRLRLPLVPALLLALGISGPALAQLPEYTLHIIPPLGGGSLGEAYATDINGANTVIGTTTGTSGAGFIWSPATGAVGMPFSATAIADDGTLLVGGDELRDGTGTVLATIPGLGNYDRALGFGIIHDHALLANPVVVGRLTDTSLAGSGCPSSNFSCINHLAHTALIWDPTSGTGDIDSFGVPASYTAYALNRTGLVVGDTNDGDQYFETTGFVLDMVAGTFVDLGTLRPDGAGYSSARAVNDAGQVAGYATAPGFGGDDHAFLWTAATGLQDIGTLGPSVTGIIDQSRGFDMNESGVVVGESSAPDTVHPLAIRHAFVWDPVLGMRDLNDLVILPGDLELVSAVAINDAGWICGRSVGSAGGGFSSVFVLEPIATSDPELVRGDCNVDGSRNIADAIEGLDLLFGGGTASCDDACDANDDGALNIADPITLLAALFQAGSTLPLPGPDCGVDTTPDGLDCASAPNCP